MRQLQLATEISSSPSGSAAAAASLMTMSAASASANYQRLKLQLQSNRATLTEVEKQEVMVSHLAASTATSYQTIENKPFHVSSWLFYVYSRVRRKKSTQIIFSNRS
jgi:hypothetical protein